MLGKLIVTFRQSDVFEMLISISFQGYVMSKKALDRLISFIKRIPNRWFLIGYFHVSH